MAACTTCGGGDPKYYIGDIGIELIIDVCATITSASVANILVEKPDGTEATWIGAVYQTTKIRYVTLEDDFDQVGDYLMQAYIEIGTNKYHGETFTVTISPLFG